MEVEGSLLLSKGQKKNGKITIFPPRISYLYLNKFLSSKCSGVVLFAKTFCFLFNF